MTSSYLVIALATETVSPSQESVMLQLALLVGKQKGKVLLIDWRVSLDMSNALNIDDLEVGVSLKSKAPKETD